MRIQNISVCIVFILLCRNSLNQNISVENEEHRFKEYQEPMHEYELSQIKPSNNNFKVQEGNAPRPHNAKRKTLKLLLNPSLKMNPMTIKTPTNSKTVVPTENSSTYILHVINNNIQRPVNRENNVQVPEMNNQEDISTHPVENKSNVSIKPPYESDNKIIINTATQRNERYTTKYNIKKPKTNKNGPTIPQKYDNDVINVSNKFQLDPSPITMERNIITFLEEINDIVTPKVAHIPEIIPKMKIIKLNNIVTDKPITDTVLNVQFNHPEQNKSTVNYKVKSERYNNEQYVDLFRPRHIVFDSKTNRTASNNERRIERQETGESNKNVKTEKIEPRFIIGNGQINPIINKTTRINDTEVLNDRGKETGHDLNIFELNLERNPKTTKEAVGMDQRHVDSFKMESNEIITIMESHEDVAEILEKSKYQPNIPSDEVTEQSDWCIIPKTWGHGANNQFDPYRIIPNVYYINTPCYCYGYYDPDMYKSDYNNAQFNNQRNVCKRKTTYIDPDSNQIKRDIYLNEEQISANPDHYNIRTPYNLIQQVAHDKFKERIWRKWKNTQVTIKRIKYPVEVEVKQKNAHNKNILQYLNLIKT